MFFASPLGLMFTSDLLLMTLLSPILIISLPLTVNEIYHGYYPKCMRLSDMVREWQKYTLKDFIV